MISPESDFFSVFEPMRFWGVSCLRKRGIFINIFFDRCFFDYFDLTFVVKKLI